MLFLNYFCLGENVIHVTHCESLNENIHQVRAFEENISMTEMTPVRRTISGRLFSGK